MRGLPIVMLVIAIGAVLVISLRSAEGERRRLFHDFATAQTALAKGVAADLENRLQDLDEDGQLLARLAHDAWQSPALDGNGRNQVILSTFRALATLVRHYRSVVLFPSDGTESIVAIDPAEASEGASILLSASRKAATAAHANGNRMSGPIQLPDGRPIYLYVVSLQQGALVVTVDGTRFLAGLMRNRPNSRLMILDGGGTLWSGCSEVASCRPKSDIGAGETTRELVTATLAAPQTLRTGAAWSDLLTLPAGPFASASARVSSADAGGWILLVATAAGALQRRQQTLLQQLVATAAGLLLSVGLVGGFIIRQQRRAAALAERLRHAEALRRLEDQLVRAEKLATTGVLAAGIAHEIGTPLAIIRGRAELLLEQSLGDAATKGMDAIIQQIDRISGTIRQVLDFSRAQPVEPQPIDAARVLTDTLELLAHRFRQQDIRVAVDVGDDVPAVAADRDQLQQVLVNVFFNACDAMTRGGNLSVTLRRATTGVAVAWEIHDDGCGVAPENLNAVFDPFFSTKKRGEGTGLGLSVAASIVRNHGGDIALSSVQGRGTSVRIVWPSKSEGVSRDV